MACYHPLIAVDYGMDSSTGKHHVKILPKRADSNLERLRSRFGNNLMMLPCGHCIGCAQDYARMWQARIMAEYEERNIACFVTLTFDSRFRPRLDKCILRNFVKAVRNKFGNGIKFFGCGELGEHTQRPHYHIILFGVDFKEDRKLFGKNGLYLTYTSPTLRKIWPYGNHLIGELDLASAGYVAKYCDKKKIENKDRGEFLIMSRGLGKSYFEKHKDDLMSSDFIYFKGSKFKIPRYFLKLSEKLDFIDQLDFFDYKERKRKVAQSFRFGSNKSVHFEEEGMILDQNYLLAKRKAKECFRDVGIY